MPSESPINQLVDDFFRKKSAEVLSVLTRIYGVEHLELAENSLQEAMIKALKTWPYQETPRNPGGWIFRVARNAMIDHLRRNRIYVAQPFDDVFAELRGGGAFEQGRIRETDPALLFEESALQDDLLKMMFVCCHPELSGTARIVLTMKTLCGLNYAEIGRAIFKSEAAVQKILMRARQRIKERVNKFQFEFPEIGELRERLDVVLSVLYLLFNEGYSATAGENIVRHNLCFDAIRMVTAVQESNIGRYSRVDALLALMLLQTSRSHARVGPDGAPIPLALQDRSRWDRELIARGLQNLELSMNGNEVSVYHLQAGIAACHAVAPDYQDTDWSRILELYDQLLEVTNSPVVALNRLVALSYTAGPEIALKASHELESNEYLQEYHLLPATIADLYRRTGGLALAKTYYERALQYSRATGEQRFLRGRIAECSFD
ncbi:MAG: sigma-70 family RNA polymerase sigma factor [Leptospirales bacterium]|jgi:RNA polymerase sigma factor (sigma-70 family)